MKLFGKYLLVFLWVFGLIFLGYLTVFNNLSIILKIDKPDFNWKETQCFEYQLRIGQWVESISLRPPIKLDKLVNDFSFQIMSGVLEVNRSPHLKIRWKKRGEKRRI